MLAGIIAYTEFLPGAEQLEPGVTQGLLAADWHRWKTGMRPEEVKQILEFYQRRYKQ